MFDIWSADEYLKEELETLQTIFYYNNDYPHRVIDDAKRFHQQIKMTLVVMITRTCEVKNHFDR